MSDIKEKVQITKDANIADLVFRYPESADVLLSFGLHCVGCFANAFDTIEQGAQIHGMSDDEVEELIAEINIVINKEDDLANDG